MGVGNDLKQPYDESYKIVFEGDKKTGKTSILKYYLEGKKYTSSYEKISKYEFYKSYRLNSMIEGKNVVLNFCDFKTQEGSSAITKSKKTDVFVFVFDISDKSTYVFIKNYLSIYKRLSEENDALMILVGNKVDLPKRKVDKEEAQNFAKENELEFIETSVVNNEGLNELFNLIIDNISKRVKGVYKPIKKNISSNTSSNLMQKPFYNANIANANNDSKVIIEYLEKKIQNLENELRLEKEKKSLSNISDKESSKIIKLYDQISECQQEIKDLQSKLAKFPFILSQNEELMSVIISTEDRQILYSIICKNSDKFSRIEEKFYDKYPNLRNEDNVFFVNNKKIKRLASLSENHLKNSDIIILKINNS